MLRLLATSCLLLILLPQVGCGSTPSAPTPQDLAHTFPQERYSAFFDASIQALRESGFEIERSDYRFGTITTKPKESPTAAEFWIDDATTPSQTRSDTLNAQQRTVTVSIKPQPAISGEPGTADQPRLYILRVQAMVQRQQRPDRYLTHSATGRLTSVYTATPEHLASRGIDKPYAQTLTRDPWLEKRLIQAIRSAADQ